MADYITKIRTSDGDKQIDYNALGNKPEAIKNPNALTITGAASGTYDGSAAVTVNIPKITASDDTPVVNGTASAGTKATYSRADHVHPTDTTRAAVSAIPTKTSALTNDSGFITSSSLPVASSNNPIMDGTAAPGSSAQYSRADHVHPTDTSRAAVSSIPSKTSQLTNDSGYITAASVPQPSNTLPLSDGAASAGTGAQYSRYDHRHPTDTSRAAVADIPTKVSELTNDAGYAKSAEVPTKTSALTNDSGFITSASVPSPSNTVPIKDGTASAGSGAQFSRYDHVHPYPIEQNHFTGTVGTTTVDAYVDIYPNNIAHWYGYNSFTTTISGTQIGSTGIYKVTGGGAAFSGIFLCNQPAASVKIDGYKYRPDSVQGVCYPEYSASGTCMSGSVGAWQDALGCTFACFFLTGGSSVAAGRKIRFDVWGTYTIQS